jgi:hypothetical protein
MSVVSSIIRLSKEMENKMSNINQTGELIANLKLAGQKNDTVYAYAFGMAWAYLSEKGREEVLKSAEKMAKEKN